MNKKLDAKLKRELRSPRNPKFSQFLGASYSNYHTVFFLSLLPDKRNPSHASAQTPYCNITNCSEFPVPTQCVCYPLLMIRGLKKELMSVIKIKKIISNSNSIKRKTMNLKRL